MHIWAVVGNIVHVILKREAVERKKRCLGFFNNEPVWFADISCIQFHDQAGTSKKGNFGIEIDVLCLMLNKLGWYRKNTGYLTKYFICCRKTIWYSKSKNIYVNKKKSGSFVFVSSFLFSCCYVLLFFLFCFFFSTSSEVSEIEIGKM